MTPITTKLYYHQRPLDALIMDGQVWLSSGQIDRPLGYSNPNQVTRLYRRHRDEFTKDEVRLVGHATAGGRQETWFFSLRGAELLAMLARTPQGKRFRRWVLDVLQGRRQRKAVQQLWLPGTYRVSSETARALQDALQLIEDGHPPQDAIQEILNGSRPLSRDPEVDNILERVRLGRKMKSDGARIEAHALRDASRRNYSKEFVQLELLRAGGDATALSTIGVEG